jgi:nucleotide-binding universal stress UspA family protein
MRKVLAAVDNSSAAGPVLATAVAVAELFGLHVEAVHVREDGSRTAEAEAHAAGVELKLRAGDPIPMLTAEAAADDVDTLAVGVRGTPAGPRPAGHIALALITTSSKPIVVVPPETVRPVRLTRALVPLDGSHATTEALRHTIELAVRAKATVIALHVRKPPPFSEQPQYETEVWAEEFLERYSPCPLEDVTLELRLGAVGQRILDAVNETHSDIVILGWSQNLTAGHATVIRDALERSPVPLLLLPVPVDTVGPAS